MTRVRRTESGISFRCPGFTCYRCHSVITDGRIAFQADCTHALAGQTVDLPEITEAL